MMPLDPNRLAELITGAIQQEVFGASTVTRYREPLVGFVSASDRRFSDLGRLATPTHLLPQDLLQGAQSVVSFFLPFDHSVVEANSQSKVKVAREWAIAYAETNILIGEITAHLIDLLSRHGVLAAAEPATGNFDPVTLISRWSHKSMAVLAGLGSFGLNHLVITDAGCAGRLGSLVIDAELPIPAPVAKERCRYYHNGGCMECVNRCPVNALSESGIDKQRCWLQCQRTKEAYEPKGQSKGCGKCSVGPCATSTSV
jgi:epoxyqueuosine reductase QueG